MLLFIFPLILVLLLSMPFLLVILTKKENTKGHWYPVTLKYLTNRKAALIKEYGVYSGVKKYFREFLIAAHFLWLIAIGKQNLLFVVAFTLLAIWTSYKTEYFVLIHRVYYKARYTSLAASILITLLLYAMLSGGISEGVFGFYGVLVIIFWHARLIAFRAIHWYRVVDKLG